MLDERKFRILQAVIDDYIMTATPVGSRAVSRKSGVGYSPATIRNDMSDLEELGYLDQPHISSGRVPSAKAYRLYVDQLMRQVELDPNESERIKAHFAQRAREVESVIRSAASVLSDVTRYTSVVVTPRVEHMRIRNVQLVPVSEGAALMIVVTSAGIVKDSVIRVPENLTAEHLFRISQMLTEQLRDLPLSEVRAQFSKILRDMGSHRRMLASIMDVLENQLAIRQEAEVVVGGSSNMLAYPEYSDIDKARNFLAILESKERLYPLLRRAGTLEFTVRIGPENDLPEMRDASLVTASYRVGEGTVGTIGVIGPTRMDYARVMAVLDLVGRSLSELLSGK